MPTTFTTDLPDEDQPVLGNGVEDEIAVDRESAVSNYGSVRIQIRETGETSWDANATGFGEFIGAYDTLSMEFVGREDGEEYEVRERTETEHVLGTWTTPVSITTQFPGVTAVTVTGSTSSTVSLEAQDNADNEDGVEVWRADELDPARDTGFSPFAKIDTLDPQTGVFTYTDSGLDPNHDYQYYFVPYTEHTSATSDSATGTTDVVYSSTWTLELRRADGDILTIDGDGLIEESFGYRNRKPSAITSWDVKLPRTPVIEEWLESEAFWWYNGQLHIRGPLHRHQGYESIHGKGVGWRLKQGGASRTVSSQEGWAAARDYIDEETPFTAIATRPSVNLIDEGKIVQEPSSTSEYQSVFAPAVTAPFVARNGGFELVQTCWTREGEDYDNSGGGAATVNADANDDWSGGTAALLKAEGAYHEYVFEVEHTIPADEVGVWIRYGDSSGSGLPAVDCVLNGHRWSTSISGIDVEDGSTFWRDFGQNPFDGALGYQGTDLTPGTYTLRVECVGTGGGGEFKPDIVAPLDNRFEYTFPDATDANGYLPGPELYPVATIETTVHDDTYNITAASLTTTMPDISGSQRLQVSNDGRQSWYPQDGSQTNTETISIPDFATVGTDIQARVTLSRHGSRTTATPTQGFQGQRIEDWALSIDTNSLGVIDQRDFTGNHFSNLKAICQAGGVVFVPRMKDGVLEIEVFATGDKTGTLDVTDGDVIDHDRVVDRESYANLQTVYGGDDGTGSLLEATARSQTEIKEHGEVRAPPEVNKNLSAKSDVENAAAQLLAERIDAWKVTGWMDLLPEFAAQLRPGYEYVLTYGDFNSDALVLQDLQYSDLRSTHLSFEDGEDIAKALAALSGEMKQNRDAI